MDLRQIGALIRKRRREQGLTLVALAARARVGRSTLAALESGKLPELGVSRVIRICEALDLVVDVRPLRLATPLMPHRHLTEAAGRELTCAAIDEIISRGDMAAWRGLVRAMRADRTQRIAARVLSVTAATAGSDPRARAFAALLPLLVPKSTRSTAAGR